jgi:hypothetical protein
VPIRAKRALAVEAMHAMCNAELASVIDVHRATELMAALV